ncbi:hypothetical protein [Halobacillus sp. H74]|uniref:hypothetical protein n=1 Tax=Halobacillus sp. H74 TaxID=3457436 RepID=UPI003FCC2BDB
MIDGYKMFMEKFNISDEQMIQFGIEETLTIPDHEVKSEWSILKENVYHGNNKVYVRGYGRDARGTEQYLKLYKELFGHNNFYKDPTNNAEPTKLLKRLTGYARQEKPSSKYKRIRNFQVSHIFGKTKNPFLFTAPWNIVYVPKIMDPFTGHESKGELTEKFQKRFLSYFHSHFSDYIDDYNELMSDLRPKVIRYLEEHKNEVSEKFTVDALDQFDFIKPN